MQLSFGCLSAVLGSAVAMANEYEKPVVPISIVVSSNKLKMKKTIRSSPSAFAMVKDKDIYKKLSRQAYVRDDKNRMENNPSIDDGDGGTDFDVDKKVNTKEAAGASVAVSAIATTTTTTTAVVSTGEVCVPPVTVTETGKFDTGHLPLSSCSSKKKICIKSNNNDFTLSSSSIKKTGECADIWDITPSYLDTSDPNNDVRNIYWEDLSSTNIAGTSVIYKAGGYADDPSSFGDTRNVHIRNNYWEDSSLTAGSKNEDNLSIHGEDPYANSLFGYYQGEDDRHLKELYGTSAAPGSSQTLSDCQSYCNDIFSYGKPSPVTVTGYPKFRNLVASCLWDATSNLCKSYGPLVCWDTSQVDNMDSAFRFQQSFNEPLECWDVSQVTSMITMFEYAYTFNQPLDTWDVSQVSNMSNMFRYAELFNQPLDLWDVSQVGDMRGMFYSAVNFNQCLSTWASETITLNTQQMFARTDCSCYNNGQCDCGTPDPDNGPWCQTAEQCSATPPPSPVDCEDDTKIKFFVGPDKKKKCNKIKASQCDIKYETNNKGGKKKPNKSCPSICNPKCLCFEDKSKKYKLKGKDKKLNCKNIKKQELCKTKVKGTGGEKAKKVCPVSCKYRDCK